MGNGIQDSQFTELFETVKRTPHLRTALAIWPETLKKQFRLNCIVLYYRDSEGGIWRPYSPDILVDSLPLLTDDHTIIESFTSIQEPLALEKATHPHFTLYDRDLQGLLDREQMNLIIPLHARRYYRGLFIASVPKLTSQKVKAIGVTVTCLFLPMIGLLEAEELDMQKDRNYYRLFQFDRLVLLGKMAASLAHELRTPLATVLFEINELGEMFAADSDAATCRTKIVTEITRANKLIESLLVFSKFKEMEIERIDLHEFIPQAMRELPARKLRADIEVSIEIPADLFIRTDTHRLRQVLFNILFNAIESIPFRGVIQVKAYRQTDEGLPGAKVIISIQDSGTGIPDHLKQRVLEPFFTTKKEGTGLGLYIVYGIMKTLKGDLEIQSSPEGTRVDLIFPGDDHVRKNIGSHR